MRLLMSWEQFLRRNPRIERKWFEAVDAAKNDPGPIDCFYYEITGHDPNESWGPANEYGERAWRIAGKRLSIIVWDEGNGWSTPLGVEIEVSSFKYVRTKLCLELTCPSGHKTKIFTDQKIACKTCGWEPLITWNGKSHFFEVKE